MALAGPHGLTAGRGQEGHGARPHIGTWQAQAISPTALRDNGDPVHAHAMPRLTTLPRTGPDDSHSPAQPSGGQAPGVPRPAERFALRVAPSPIDGQGVFAEEAIPARQKVGEIRGEAISVQEARLRARSRARIHIIELNARRALDATGTPGLLRFVNHSCGPNTQLKRQQGRVEFYSLRDIAPGEELTADYGETHHEGRLRCRCGAPQCKGQL